MIKTEAKKYLTLGNSKLSNGIATFDLPATKEVCGRACPGCYAEKAQRIYPSVLPSREKKLMLSKHKAFTDAMNKAIHSLQPHYIRIHSSGEFYSQQYIEKWAKIARSNLQRTFYAYTKRMKDFDFSPLTKLPNCVIIDSLHSGALNYGAREQAPPDMFLCPDEGRQTEKVCGVSCTYCMTKEAESTGVFFVKH